MMDRVNVQRAGLENCVAMTANVFNRRGYATVTPIVPMAETKSTVVSSHCVLLRHLTTIVCLSPFDLFELLLRYECAALHRYLIKVLPY